MTRYWVDASSFIWANRELFPYDDVRGYWNWLASRIDNGDVVTHKKAFEEVIAGAQSPKPDPVAVWLKSRKGAWCSFGETEESQVLLGEISTYCLDRYGFPVSKQSLSGADARLIARAKIDNGIVVCQESETKEPRIPKICSRFDVRCITLIKMNILLGMRF